MKRIATIVCIAIILIGCSSAPKGDGTVADVKNSAAEYAEFGNRYYQAADYVQAEKFFLLALEMNISVDNITGIAESHNSLGKVYLRSGDLKKAETHFSEAYTLSADLSDDMKLKTAGNLGEYWLITGDLDKAQDYLTRGLSYADSSPDSAEAAILYHNAGVVYKRLERYETAVGYIEKALAVNKKLESFGELAANYYLLSSIYSKQEQYGEALEYAEMALSNDKMVENRTGIAGDLYALALIHRKSGNEEVAYEYFRKAYLVYEAMNMPADMKKALLALVESTGELGLDEEKEIYEKALELLEERRP